MCGGWCSALPPAVASRSKHAARADQPTAAANLTHYAPLLARFSSQVDVTEAETPVQVGDSACLICEQRPLNSLSDVRRTGCAGL